MRNHLRISIAVVALGACHDSDSADPFRDATDAAADVHSSDRALGGADAAGSAVASPATIVHVTPEAWGVHCPRGGVKIQTALDRNANHIIDSLDDTLGEEFICNVYPSSVSVGSRHACAMASNSAVWCWGADDVGQLGDSGQVASYSPRPVAGVGSALALAVGDDFACVILPTTGVRCWGNNDRGQCGHETDRPFISPSCVTNDGVSLLGAVSLATGGTHACAVLDDGTVHCWGANQAGQLGDGTNQDRNHPVQVLGISDARQVVAGGGHTCVMRADATVRCWGANEQGQGANSAIPLAGVTALAAGDAFTCAILDDASVACWGALSDCQSASALPTAAPVRDVKLLAAGRQHVCAVLTSGKAVCWGRNDVGQLGAPASACRATAVEIPLAHVTSIASGRTHSCAVDDIGLWCWGDNSQGQLGTGIASASRSSSDPQLALWPLAP